MEQKFTKFMANFYLCNIRKYSPENGAKFTKFMTNFCLCSIKKTLPKMEQKFTKFMANIRFFLLGYT